MADPPFCECTLASCTATSMYKKRSASVRTTHAMTAAEMRETTCGFTAFTTAVAVAAPAAAADEVPVWLRVGLNVMNGSGVVPDVLEVRAVT